MKPKGGRIQWKSKNNQRFNQKRQPAEYRHCDQLTEKDVGITEYLSTLDGFSGVIKARYSDFQLNEIDLEGNIAKLTNTDIPKDFSLKMVKYNYKEIIESPNKHIPQQIWESMKKIVDDNECEPVILDAENIAKDSRKEIHECVKSHFGNKIIASTVEVDGKKVMKFEKFRNEKKVDARLQWPVDKGEYVYFIVYKEKMDTLEATFKISTAIGMGTSNFHHAGNKDKRSITSQWFCVKKIDPWKLIVKTKSVPNIKIGNITFKDVPLRLGHLKGNKFRIALRNVIADDEVINEGIQLLKEQHFINYYGLQRFGNDKEVPTYKVGISLLQGKWKEAVDLILKPKTSDDVNSPYGDVVKAKKVYAETGDALKAYAELGKNKTKSLEGKLLEGLKCSNENDYINALERVPRQMRLLYLHAFQSLVWNRMVSQRLQKFGKKPVVGDLVLINDEETLEEADNESNDLVAGSSKEQNDTGIKCKQQVKCLCENDLNNYSIFDIVLPLPGYDIIYPDHMKTYYKECIEEYGLDLEMTKQKVKTYTLSGNYRKILGRVEDLTWKIVKYNNPTDNLIVSDVQELKGVHDKPQTDENGQYKAVIMEFSLSACSYATMVIREITKINTSSNDQSKLNNYHEPDQKKNSPSKLENISSENQRGDEEEENSSQTSSLLADAAKYELFKNSIFGAIGQKRPCLDSEESSKKQKLEETELKTD